MPFLPLDIRYAARSLRRSPAYSFVACLTLASAICANVVVFGVLQAIVFRSLHVAKPNSLFQVRHKNWAAGRLITTSYPAFEDLRRRNTTFSDMAAVNGYSSGTIRSGQSLTDVHGNAVSCNYFDLLGVLPALGSFFHLADEHGPGSMPFLVLSDGLWRRLFNADPSVIGRTVTLNKQPFTIVAVARADFHGVERFVWPDYWMPLVNDGQERDLNFLQDREHISTTVLGRLKKGVSAEAARENLNSIARQLNREYPMTDDGLPLRLIHPGLWGDDGELIRGFLYGVTALAFLVLLAACANLASLFAARAADRRSELAVRSALGAGKAQLVKQMLTEAFVLSTIGGFAGLVLAQVLLRWLSLWPKAAEVHLSASVNAPVLLVGFAFVLASALLFGWLPAQSAANSDPTQAMSSGRGVTSEAPKRWSLRDGFLAVQIGICMLLLMSSLVAMRGLYATLHVPLGFEPRGAMLADIGFDDDDGTQSSPDSADSRQRQLLDLLRGVPGVTAVGAASHTPMTGGIRGTPVYWPGTTEFTLKNFAASPYVYSVSPGYLAAAQVRLLSGRAIGFQDGPATRAVGLVNGTFARKMWGSEKDAIGRRLIINHKETEIVGIVANGKYHELTEEPQGAVFLPFAQNPSDATIVIRSPFGPNEMTGRIESVLRGSHTGASVNLVSWSESLSDVLLPAQAATIALGVLGLLAAMLALTGVGGMAAYGVSRRRKEIGIRVALGARRTQVVTAAIRQPMRLLAIGTVVGLTVGIVSGRLLTQVVYQADPLHPFVIAGALALMVCLGLTATAIPIRQALRIDAASLLRDD